MDKKLELAKFVSSREYILVPSQQELKWRGLRYKNITWRNWWESRFNDNLDKYLKKHRKSNEQI